MTPLVTSVTMISSVLTVCADLAVVCAIIFFVASLASHSSSKINRWLAVYESYALIASFVISLGGVLGSLFYSEIAGFAPCELCWWQRIFLFPQFIILGLAVWYNHSSKRVPKDTERHVEYFALLTSLALSLIGGAYALYHSYGLLINPDVLPACAAVGVSCSKLYFLYFGYVAIPTMSLTLFLMLLANAALHFRGRKYRT